MSVCSRLKGYARGNDRIADLFSLLAVALLFCSIWFAIDFQIPLISWMKENIIINGSLAMLGLVMIVFMIIALLSIGSSRFSEEENDACFATFKGRRHGGPSLGMAVKHWITHIEQVNKKHR